MDALIPIALVVGSYVVGSLPIGLLVAKAAKGVDIREHGSGNIGATNVARIVGVPWGITVFALDLLKGLLPTLAAAHLVPESAYAPPLVVVLCGIAAICGHNFSVFLKFRGGKGVSTSAGVFFYLFPLGAAMAMAVWILAVAATRYVSVGSMLAGIALSAGALTLPDDPFDASRYLTAVCLAVTALVLVRHKSNIKRLLAGTESRIGGGSKSDE